jgi:hypothetical protein
MRAVEVDQSENSTHAEPERFVAIVDELEHHGGRRLRGEGRARCLRAFIENPDGFARVALSAKRKARTSPFGLLICMVDDREHLLGATMRGAGKCFVCGRHTDDAVIRHGQYWCIDCESKST